MSILSLPRKVRDMVYHLCLVVEYVIVPYPRTNETKFQGSRPCIALLEVSKIIRAEARPILYRHNKWQADSSPSHLGILYYFNQCFEHVVLKLSADDDVQARRISNISQIHGDLDELLFRDGRDLTEVERTQERAKEIHRRLLDVVKISWHLKMAIVWRLYHLRSITIDVSRLFCPTGCCRLEILRKNPFGRLMDWLMNRDGHSHTDEIKVFFVGLRNKKESRLMYKEYGFKKWALDTYEMDGGDVEIDVTRQHPIEEENSDAD